MAVRTQVVRSKLLKARLLQGDRKLSGHVPDTRLLTEGTLRRMLDRYGMVYAKPDRGSLGVGVMRIEKTGGKYRCHSGMRVRAFASYRRMMSSIGRRIGGGNYVVQQGIRVLRHGGRPYDFRVMIQRNPAGSWEVTGTAGRVAHPRKAVTNGSQGGTIYPAARLLRPRAGAGRTAALLRRMNRLARTTAARFGSLYPAMNELGLDIAVDRKLFPWILEVNTRPDPCPFTKLPDKAPIRRMTACARAYGRRYDLACGKAKRAPG